MGNHISNWANSRQKVGFHSFTPYPTRAEKRGLRWCPKCRKYIVKDWCPVCGDPKEVDTLTEK